MLTVACVLWQGTFRNRSYRPEHVARLREQVAAHLDTEHRFVCLSNVDVPCERMPLERDWPGWYSKIELFKPGLFAGRVLYLDLDVTVTGNLDDLTTLPAPFVAIKDWERPTINSSVMAFYGGVADTVYESYDGREVVGGDQAWISQCLPVAAAFPPEWCISYKHQARKHFVPKDTRVIVYHGWPKSWDLPDNHLVFADAV